MRVCDTQTADLLSMPFSAAYTQQSFSVFVITWYTPKQINCLQVSAHTRKYEPN